MVAYTLLFRIENVWAAGEYLTLLWAFLSVLSSLERFVFCSSKATTARKQKTLLECLSSQNKWRYGLNVWFTTNFQPICILSLQSHRETGVHSSSHWTTGKPCKHMHTHTHTWGQFRPIKPTCMTLEETRELIVCQEKHRNIKKTGGCSVKR